MKETNKEIVDIAKELHEKFKPFYAKYSGEAMIEVIMIQLAATIGTLLFSTQADEEQYREILDAICTDLKKMVLKSTKQVEKERPELTELYRIMTKDAK